MEEMQTVTNMPLGKKRMLYVCKKNEFKTLADIEPYSSSTFSEHFKNVYRTTTSSGQKKIISNYAFAPELNKKISIFHGNITYLEIDCIVNAANMTLLGGGGVDAAIHRAAGPKLLDECSLLNGCEQGKAKITGGYCLPAKHVIHTVGPIEQGKKNLLESCYQECLKLMVENGLRTIAFPCIATGIFEIPIKSATKIALKTVRRFLEKNADKVDRIIFCLFIERDLKNYCELLPRYFPKEEQEEEEEQAVDNNNIKHGRPQFENYDQLEEIMDYEEDCS